MKHIEVVEIFISIDCSVNDKELAFVSLADHREYHDGR
jgi:hypothetical protein